MNNIEKLYQKYNYKFSGNEYFIPFDQAKSFIDDCLNLQLTIVGIEGFVIDNSGVLPLLEYIADFSSVVSKNKVEVIEKTHKSSLAFIGQIEVVDNLYLNFVLS
jgi:hypothetical protein